MRLCPRTILAVEDSPDEIFFMQMAFDELGYGERIHFARDGKEAVQYIAGIGQYADRSRFPFPCLVMTDLKMPVMNGLELIKWLREESLCKTIPAFIFTSSQSEKDFEDARNYGVNGFFQKPSVTKPMLPVLREMIASWLLHLSSCTGNPPRLCEAIETFNMDSCEFFLIVDDDEDGRLMLITARSALSEKISESRCLKLGLRLEPEMCGVKITFGNFQSGWSGGIGY
jgi:CheY-like chemotaxis protein